MSAPTAATLVVGGTYAARENAIAASLRADQQSAIILEGLPGGKPGPLDTAIAPDAIRRIAPGCLCCAGNLTMRVTLNRVLRRPPQQLFISLADAGHLAEIRSFLGAAPYRALLTLTDDLHVSS